MEPNLSTEGIAVLADSLELNGGTIRYADGRNARLNHGAIGHNSNHQVNWQTASDGNSEVDPPPPVPEYSDVVSVAVQPIAGQPKGVRVTRDQFFPLGVTWDWVNWMNNNQASKPAGTTFSDYFVEWKKHGETAWQRSSALDGDVGKHTRIGGAGTANGHAIRNLVDDGVYAVRVVARFTDGTDTIEVISAVATQQVGYVEPMLAWFIDDTPNVNLEIGRVFMMIESNRPASAICTINGGKINCPPRTLVSLDIDDTGTYNIKGQALYNTETVGANGITVNRNGMVGCRIPEEGTRVSGSADKLVVWWGDVLCNDDHSGPVIKWKIIHTYPVGMGGTSSETITVRASQRTLTFSNQTAGVHKIAVVPVSEADHDFDERDGVTIETSRCSTAGDADCTVKPTAREEVDGMAQEYSTILDSSFTQVPDKVTVGRATAGSRSVSVSWQIPESSRYYFGVEGRRYGGELHENARSPIYRYDIRYRRSEIGGIAPGRWREISTYPWYVSGNGQPNPRHARIDGLEDGLPYDVEIRAVNAVGPGAWNRIADAVTVR